MSWSSEKRSPRIWRHSVAAARWAAIVCGVLGGSTSLFRSCRRSQNALPAAWLVAVGRKNRYRKASRLLSPVHAPAKVLEEEQGDSRLLPKATVGESNP